MTRKSSPSNSRKKKVSARKPWRSRFRLADARISTMLMWILSIFMLLLVAVGALGGWFAAQSVEQTRTMGLQFDREEEVVNISNDMMMVRVNLLTAANFLQQAAEHGDAALRDRAMAMLASSTQALDTVQKNFSDIRKNMPEDTEAIRLTNRLVSSFQQYLNDGIEPMLQALGSDDYSTFYFVNTEYGMARAAAFDASAQELFALNEKVRTALQENAEEAYQQALWIMAASVLIGLLLLLVVRVVFQRMVVRRLREAQVHFDGIANGDLTQRIDIGSRNEIGALYEAMRRMQEGLTRVVSEVRAGVDEINLGSREIYLGNTDLSSRTEQQAASLQQTAASMEELDSTVRQNTDNATQANALAQSASEVAARGGAAVSTVVETMREIAVSSEQMSEIVSVIDGIAFQTNILALNAAVEAARAGEQGRGFAVVAGEVRALAQRSAQAAREIKQLIDESLVKAEQGSGRADEAGRVMEEVVAAIHGVSTIMAEISSASQEQADGIGQVNQAVTEMDGVVQQNAALVEEAAAAAGSLQTQATRLTDAVAFFRLSAGDVIDVTAQEQRRIQGGPAQEEDLSGNEAAGRQQDDADLGYAG